MVAEPPVFWFLRTVVRLSNRIPLAVTIPPSRPGDAQLRTQRRKSEHRRRHWGASWFKWRNVERYRHRLRCPERRLQHLWKYVVLHSCKPAYRQPPRATDNITLFGESLSANASGNENAAFGNLALASGRGCCDRETAYGYQSLEQTTTGALNVAFGWKRRCATTKPALKMQLCWAGSKPYISISVSWQRSQHCQSDGEGAPWD